MLQPAGNFGFEQAPHAARRIAGPLALDRVHRLDQRIPADEVHLQSDDPEQ
jgi:hypothetical protein